jgi:hypothetical protein
MPEKSLQFFSAKNMCTTFGLNQAVDSKKLEDIVT